MNSIEKLIQQKLADALVTERRKIAENLLVQKKTDKK